MDTPGIVQLHLKTARLLAVEVLLAEPEALGDDALEKGLYRLHEQLTGTRDQPGQEVPGQGPPPAPEPPQVCPGC